jgi:hypothetical protein
VQPQPTDRLNRSPIFSQLDFRQDLFSFERHTHQDGENELVLDWFLTVSWD